MTDRPGHTAPATPGCGYGGRCGDSDRGSRACSSSRVGRQQQNPIPWVQWLLGIGEETLAVERHEILWSRGTIGSAQARQGRAMHHDLLQCDTKVFGAETQLAPTGFLARDGEEFDGDLWW